MDLLTRDGCSVVVEIPHVRIIVEEVVRNDDEWVELKVLFPDSDERCTVDHVQGIAYGGMWTIMNWKPWLFEDDDDDDDDD